MAELGGNGGVRNGLPLLLSCRLGIAISQPGKQYGMEERELTMESEVRKNCDLKSAMIMVVTRRV